jgi:hypothetical protein
MKTRGKEVKVGKERIKKTEESCFEHITNIMPSKKNIHALSLAGRLRWKFTVLFVFTFCFRTFVP